VSDDRVVRWGVIGTGMMGHEHVRNLALVPGSEVVAYSDPSSEQRWWTSQLVPDARAFEDHRDLLHEGGVDAVVIASPNHTHADVLDAVFEAGTPVLCEKPLCTSVADVRRVAERAEKHPGLFWVAMEYRYMAPIARLVEEVRQGTVGRLRMLAIREHRYPFLPKVGDWNRFARNTGGTFVEKCCHFFDLMRLITGSDPVRVYASAAQDVNHLEEKYGGERPDILDNGFVTVDFASGARGLLDLCMFAEASRNEQEIAATGDAGKVECFVPEGTVVVGRRSPRSVETETVDVRSDVLAAGAHHGSTFVEHVEFRRALLAGDAPAVSARDGLWAVAMGAAAERSAAEGRPVEISELL
jgi:myo-inositol 2-dehydrogenase/D-chiro-inositol 1-dehydrogenase